MQIYEVMSPEEEEELFNEYYGPIDGVRPTDHPETYHKLIAMFCVTTTHTVYSPTSQRQNRICEECHGRLLNDQQRDFERGITHLLVGRVRLHQVTTCMGCDRQIAQIKPATRCTECIEEFLQQMSSLGNNSPPAYAIIEVITRW